MLLSMFPRSGSNHSDYDAFSELGPLGEYTSFYVTNNWRGGLERCVAGQEAFASSENTNES
jgi:hypothetical protein